jgi:hypothetical protein
VAREAPPSGATSTHRSLTKSTWGHGGCDGGPAGWTNMEAVQLFRASGNVVAEVDANMRRLHWGIVSKLNTSPAGQPPSSAPGPGVRTVIRPQWASRMVVHACASWRVALGTRS